MTKNILLLVIFSLTYSSAQLKIENVTISSFEFKQNDLELSRLAQPFQYFDKIGPRAGLMGYECGVFEMWVWPWKSLRNFELQFLLGTSTQPISGKDIVRTISATPEMTTLIYTYESFTVKEHILVPRNEPGAIILLDVQTTTPLTIIPGFIPVMQPMWPAGIGGQFSYWDDELHGYILSEAQWRAIIVCGSPAGQQMAAPPAHMFGDNPLQFKIEVKPGETNGRFIPVIITGALPDTTDWKMKFDSVKAVYSRLWKNAEKYYLENYEYYRNLRYSTLQIKTPDREINLAYEWGKVALDNLMINNPRLGYGMVAGFGLSGGGARPGFAWYFGGDAFINVLALNSAGMFKQARNALEFTQKWQRQDNFPIRKKNPDDPPRDVGKMAHELSQSDGICDWWNDYRYAYNHADTSPWYLVAMGDYVRTSGDVEFLKRSWNSIKLAYEWCLSKDSDGDGLMDLKGAGLGALEFGKLVGIYSDIYTCAIFLQGVKEVKYMAELVGDSLIAAQADAQFKKAQPGLEKLFWLDREGYYAYGATEKGEQVREKTPWSGVAMMFKLLNEERCDKSIESLNSADMSTDWGMRSLSNKSDLFDPANYNYGAVWPFISSFLNTAQFKHHFPLQGYQLLKSTVKHAFDHALGMVPEVFSGQFNEKLGEGYHHQGFSTTGYLLPLVRGLLGLENNVQSNHIDLKPGIPLSWDSVEIKNLVLGKESYNFKIRNNKDEISLTFNSKNSEPVSINFQPVLVGNQELKGSQINAPNGEIDIKYLPLPHLELPEPKGDIGLTNSSLKIISTIIDNKNIRYIMEGKKGITYSTKLMNPEGVVKIEGAEIEGEKLKIDFPGNSKNEFNRREIVITFKIN